MFGFISKKTATKMVTDASRAIINARQVETERFDAAVQALKDAVASLGPELTRLLEKNGQLKRENKKLSDALQDAYRSLQEKVAEQKKSCEGCTLIGIKSECRYCARKAPDKYKPAEVETK